MNDIIDKKLISETLEKEIGTVFAGFREESGSGNSCAVGVTENLSASGWRGEWTERIRETVRRVSPGLRCVCVKPLQLDGTAWYGIEVA